MAADLPPPPPGSEWERIEQMRQKLGLSASGFSLSAGLKKSTYYNIATRNAWRANHETYEKITRWLIREHQVPATWLLAGSEPTANASPEAVLESRGYSRQEVAWALNSARAASVFVEGVSDVAFFAEALLRTARKVNNASTDSSGNHGAVRKAEPLTLGRREQPAKVGMRVNERIRSKGHPPDVPPRSRKHTGKP